MSKTSTIKAALLGSASALGLNWIYDRHTLNKHKEAGNPMIFEAIDHELYKNAKKSFDVYPNHNVGDLDFMGEVLYLFHMFIEYEEDQSIARWREIMYEYFREDHEYDGYIEAYGKAFLEQYKKEQQGGEIQEETSFIDKQLGGLIFLLALYDKDDIADPVETALQYERTITGYENIVPLHKLLYKLLQKLDEGVAFKDAAESVLELAPEPYKQRLDMALTDIKEDKFIREYAGVACDIKQTLPLIFYILNNTSTWEEAMVQNATLGGASAGRGIFLSAIASRYLEIPAKYQDKLQYNIK